MVSKQKGIEDDKEEMDCHNGSGIMRSVSCRRNRLAFSKSTAKK